MKLRVRTGIGVRIVRSARKSGNLGAARVSAFASRCVRGARMCARPVRPCTPAPLGLGPACLGGGRGFGFLSPARPISRIFYKFLCVIRLYFKNLFEIRFFRRFWLAFLAFLVLYCQTFERGPGG